MLATESALILTFHLGKGKDLWGSGTSRNLISMEAQKKIACPTKEHSKGLFPVFSWDFPTSVLDVLFGNRWLGSRLWCCPEVPSCWWQTRARRAPAWVSQLLPEVRRLLLPLSVQLRFLQTIIIVLMLRWAAPGWGGCTKRRTIPRRDEVLACSVPASFPLYLKWLPTDKEVVNYSFPLLTLMVSDFFLIASWAI